MNYARHGSVKYPSLEEVSGLNHMHPKLGVYHWEHFMRLYMGSTDLMNQCMGLQHNKVAD